MDVLATLCERFQADSLTIGDYLDALTTPTLSLVALYQRNGPELQALYDEFSPDGLYKGHTAYLLCSK